jgi:hypothetical protein
MSRYTVAEAADMLGITTGAVRNRLSRGTLRSTKESGTVYVLLPIDIPRHPDRDADDTPGSVPPPGRDELVSELRRTNELLREVIATRDEEIRRRDVIISQLTERIPAIEAAQEPSETAETAEEGPQREEPHSTAGEAQEGVQRPWWRRMFGG